MRIRKGQVCSMEERKKTNQIKPYARTANYYETDQMAVIHHSNYIRWLEEARIDFLDQIGLGYADIEAAGLYIPVLGASCDYKSSVRFNDKVLIYPKITFFNGIKMNIEYKIIDEQTKQLRAVGETRHCFVTKEFKPVSLKKDVKNMYEVFNQWLNVEFA